VLFWSFVYVLWPFAAKFYESYVDLIVGPLDQKKEVWVGQAARGPQL